jgi:putative intracellular protease/amidase
MKAHILVYVSSARAVPFREGGSHAVGVFLGELTEPLEPLLEAGHQLTFVSPDGKPPYIDKNSSRLMYWGFNPMALKKAEKSFQKLLSLGLSNPKPLGEVLKEGLNGCDALFIPGGHAPMTDILYKNWLASEELNAETAALLSHFHRFQKTTALICHAPSVLAAAGSENGKWLYEGYKMTCVTMVSERLIEDIPPFKVMNGHIPKYPQRILEEKGAVMKQVPIPMIPNVIEDRELITGQDPYSGKRLGKRLLAKIENQISNQNQ